MTDRLDVSQAPAFLQEVRLEAEFNSVPDEIVHRKKQGFLFPWNTWLRNELQSFGDQHIKNMAQRSFVRGDRLMDYWKRFLAGDKNIRWAELWLFIVLEYWMEKNEISG